MIGLGRREGLQSDVEVDGCLDGAVTEDPAHELVVAGVMRENDRRGGMAKLMWRNLEPQFFPKTPLDLVRQSLFVFGVLTIAGV